MAVGAINGDTVLIKKGHTNSPVERCQRKDPRCHGGCHGVKASCWRNRPGSYSRLKLSTT
eukprot:scaffold5841_cov28-Cyclotella_meneghiniana.AAC.2